MRNRFYYWLNNKWVENSEERLTHQQKPLDFEDYWIYNRRWLTQQYRAQRRAERKNTYES